MPEIKTAPGVPPQNLSLHYSQAFSQLGVDEKEVNIRNKLSRGKFTAAFFLQCLEAIDTQTLRLDS